MSEGKENYAMDKKEMLQWLQTEKGLSNRSAHDVMSRLKRVLSLTNQSKVTNKTLALLDEVEEFNACSSFVKSQLRRSVRLYNEFGNKDK